MRRVVVTGIGTVNALAHDLPGTFAALREGKAVASGQSRFATPTA
jgi:nodulation protein E